MTEVVRTLTSADFWMSLLAGAALGMLYAANVVRRRVRRGELVERPAKGSPEVELFTVTTPNAYPVGEVVTFNDRAYTITRHEELGQVRPIGGVPRWPVRVWGRPA